MRLMTKGGRPLRPGNADPAKSRAAMIYFYRTRNGRTEIRIWPQKQNLQTRRWKPHGKAGIYHSSSKAITGLIGVISGWDQETDF